MDFFEGQEQARRNTGRLVLLLTLAVVSLITVTSLLLSILISGTDGENPTPRILGVVDPSVPGPVALAIIALVLGGMLYKYLQLQSGGRVVAEMLGGRLIPSDTPAFDERQVLNVVEEIAIAAGIRVPPVYLLEDTGINAFAAGLTQQDAVIGVTRGTINLLSRDELQGVIAHEFSHILHGDMRLNTRLIALLHGILLLGLIGALIIRSLGRVRSSGNNKSAVPVIVAAGFLLMAVGYAGTFFGNLIRSAVSRQREFLADAAAVQFTRNPAGIAGALKKIGGYTQGSLLQAEHAAQFSHLYFGAGLRQSSWNLMATHPPLNERIRRIEPGWDGSFPTEISPRTFPQRPTPTDAAALHHQKDRANRTLRNIAGAVGAIGVLDNQSLQLAQDSLLRLPEPLKEAIRTPPGAQATAYVLLLSNDDREQEKQLQVLSPLLTPGVMQQLELLLVSYRELDGDLRLPLLDLTIPALMQLEVAELQALESNLLRLKNSGTILSLNSRMLMHILITSIRRHPSPPGKYQLCDLKEDTALLLWTLAQAGNEDPEGARAAFRDSVSSLPFSLPAPDPGPPDLARLDDALDRLNQLWPLQKPLLLKAMSRCIIEDGRITTTEVELIRAVASILDCPMPPLPLSPA